MNQINLRRFIYKLYQTKTYDKTLINRVEKELTVNLKNKYILENILNFLIKMLRIKIKEGGEFEAVNVNKLNEMIKVCLKELDLKENPKHLIYVFNFTANFLKSLKKEDITINNKNNTENISNKILINNKNNTENISNKILINNKNNTENISNKILINLYSKLLFDYFHEKENMEINEEILSTIIQFFSKKFLNLFSDLKYKTNNLNIEILNRNAYKLNLYFLCFFIKTNKIEKDFKQFIKPLYISYFIIENHLITEKHLNVCDSNFYELNNRKELIKETLKILFRKIIKNLNLKKILILKKYNKFMQFLDKNALKEIIKSINSFKTVNENVIKVYEEILLSFFKNKEKVFIKLFDFLENKKQTDLILEYKFFYLINLCNDKIRIEKFLIENLFSIKKRVSFNFKVTTEILEASPEILKEEELLSIFLYAFNKTISSELNKIFLIEKIYFNNKNFNIYVFELINYRSSLIPLLGSVYKPTDVIVLNEYLKHILLYLIYKQEIKDIPIGIETYLNPKDILKLDPTKNSQFPVIENFLQIYAEIIKHFSKLHKTTKIEINDALFNHKGLWENLRTRSILLLIYKLINKSDILENLILKNLSGNSVTPEILNDLQILGNSDATDFIFHLFKGECLCLKNDKTWLEIFERNFLFSDNQNMKKFLKNFLKNEVYSPKEKLCLSEYELDICPVMNKDKCFINFSKQISLKKGDPKIHKKYFEELPSKHTFLFSLKFNRHSLSSHLTFLIKKFPLEKYNNLILQLKIERLILLKDFLKELESKQLQLSLFKRTSQSFEIFFDKKIRLFEYKNFKSLTKINSFSSKFEGLNLKNFSTENPLINSLKNILTEKDAEKFIDVFFRFGGNKNLRETKKGFLKNFFAEKVYFYFFILCFLKFQWLFEEKKEVLNSFLFSCEFLDVEIEDFF